jgi:hypothetical protein
MYSIVTLLSVTARQLAAPGQCRAAAADFDIGSQKIAAARRASRLPPQSVQPCIRQSPGRLRPRRLGDAHFFCGQAPESSKRL